MGVFDLPASMFAWLDDQAGAIASPAIRLVLWGVLAALISMAIYRRISAQERIRRGRIEIEQARRQLDAHDGEWDEAKPLLGQLLRSAFAQVGRVGWPSVVASLPLLSLLAWLSSSYEQWSRVWWVPFFTALVAASLMLKRWWRIA